MNTGTQPPSSLIQRHLDFMREFYDAAPPEPTAAAQHYRGLLARYYRLFIPADSSVLEVGCGSGTLLAQLPGREKAGIDLSAARIAAARRRLPEAAFHVAAGEDASLGKSFDRIVVSETLNLAGDVQQMLENLRRHSHEHTRLLVNFPSALWRPLLSLGHVLGLKGGDPQGNWLATSDVINLLNLSGWEVVQVQPRILVPLPLLGLEHLVNRWLAPLVSPLCLTVFCIARPAATPAEQPPSVSVVIPARNEAGNIEAAVLRTPDFGGRRAELLFVEGNSRDNTWEEIQRVQQAYPEKNIRIMQQKGRGKGDAVRLGFAEATGDILMILDADLTMPPEELPKFFEAIASGRAEFVNGCRLVYPMEKEAMQFLNLCANKAFGMIFTWLLGQPLKDTLCGTKVLSRRDYATVAANRSYFGEFDPFGDFDLLFGASKACLKIADVPIRYRDRTYGTTNIQRWRHGWLLLRMVGFAARKLKFV